MLGPDGQPVVTPPETLLGSDLNAAPLEQVPLVVDLGSAEADPAALFAPFSVLPADPGVAPIVSDPLAGQPAAPAAAPLDKLTYKIKSGDTLGHIAQRELGSVKYTNDILLLNPGLNVNNLQVGMELKLPKRSELPPAPAPRDTAPAAPAAAGETTHSVVAGDTLWGLAARFLGDGSRSGEIVAANPDKLKSKDAVLTIGMKLRIPKR
jgi:nucleoid-associated protein YgaU